MYNISKCLQKYIKKTEKFFQKYPFFQYKKGDLIVRPDEKINKIYYLKKGMVKEYIVSDNDSRLVIHIFRPGAFFLMTWLVNPINSCFFEAVNNVEIHKVPIEEVKKFVRSEPEDLFNFTLRLLKGVDGLTKRLETIVFDQAYIKVASLLSYIAKTFGADDHVEIVVNFPLTHKEIASWTGITRETASLQVEELEKKGIISYRGRQMVVNNLIALEKEITSQKVS